MIENNVDIASLICYTSLTVTGIFVAVIGFIQTYYSMFESLEDFEIQVFPDVEKGKRRFQITQKLQSLNRYLRLVKLMAVIFVSTFFLSFVWIILMEVNALGCFLWWYSRFIVGTFCLSFVSLIYIIIKIKIGEGK